MDFTQIKDDLVCPACKSVRLIFEDQLVWCEDCKRKYPVTTHDGQRIVNFIPDFYSQFQNPVLKLWKYLLETSAHEEERLLSEKTFSHVDEYGVAHGSYGLSSGKILDIGGGSGELRRCIGENVEYVDIEPDIDAYGRRELLEKFDTGLGRPFLFLCGVAEYIPFRSGLFDTAVMDGMIEHVFDITASFAEAQRVLKFGGKLYLSADCRGIEVKSADLSFGKKIINRLKGGGLFAVIKRVFQKVTFAVRRKLNPWRNVLDFSQAQIESGHIYDNLKKDDIVKLAMNAGFSKVDAIPAGKGTVFILIK